MAGVLGGRGRPVPEVPLPGCRAPHRIVRKLHHLPRGRIAGTVGEGGGKGRSIHYGYKAPDAIGAGAVTDG